MKKSKPGEGVATPWRGFSLIVIITIVVVSIFFLEVAVRATTEGERITVITSSAPGLRAGSTVWVAGRPAGRVLSVDFKPPSHSGPNVVIRAALQHNAGLFIRADARVAVRTSDLLAPVVVAIDPGSGNEAPWDYADTLRTGGRPLDQEAIVALSDSLLEGVRRLRTQAEDTKRTVGNGPGSLALIQQSPNLLHDIRHDLKQIQETLENNFPNSLLGQLVADTVLGPSLARIRDQLARWSDLPNRENSLLSVKTTTEAFDTIASRLQRVIGNVSAGEGTAGRLLVDRELTHQVELLKAQISNLSEYLKNHPVTWLRVRAF